jgi:hypothetical protein
MRHFFTPRKCSSDVVFAGGHAPFVRAIFLPRTSCNSLLAAGPRSQHHSTPKAYRRATGAVYQWLRAYGTAELEKIPAPETGNGLRWTDMPRMLGQWGHAVMTSNGWAVETVIITVGMLTGEAVRQMLLLAASVIRTRRYSRRHPSCAR